MGPRYSLVVDSDVSRRTATDRRRSGAEREHLAHAIAGQNHHVRPATAARARRLSLSRGRTHRRGRVWIGGGHRKAGADNQAAIVWAIVRACPTLATIAPRYDRRSLRTPQTGAFCAFCSGNSEKNPKNSKKFQKILAESRDARAALPRHLRPRSATGILLGRVSQLRRLPRKHKQDNTQGVLRFRRGY